MHVGGLHFKALAAAASLDGPRPLQQVRTTFQPLPVASCLVILFTF